jgi:hypothetical protein
MKEKDNEAPKGGGPHPLKVNIAANEMTRAPPEQGQEHESSFMFTTSAPSPSCGGRLRSLLNRRNKEQHQQQSQPQQQLQEGPLVGSRYGSVKSLLKQDLKILAPELPSSVIIHAASPPCSPVPVWHESKVGICVPNPTTTTTTATITGSPTASLIYSESTASRRSSTLSTSSWKWGSVIERFPRRPFSAKSGPTFAPPKIASNPFRYRKRRTPGAGEYAVKVTPVTVQEPSAPTALVVGKPRVIPSKEVVPGVGTYGRDISYTPKPTGCVVGNAAQRVHERLFGNPPPGPGKYDTMELPKNVVPTVTLATFSTTPKQSGPFSYNTHKLFFSTPGPGHYDVADKWLTGVRCYSMPKARAHDHEYYTTLHLKEKIPGPGFYDIPPLPTGTTVVFPSTPHRFTESDSQKTPGVGSYNLF